MSAKPRITVQVLYADYTAGLSMERVAAKYGWTFWRVRSAFLKAGLRIRKCSEAPRPLRLPAQRVQLMYADYSTGMSLAAVGRRYGCSSGALREVFVKRGLEVREAAITARRIRRNGTFVSAPPLSAQAITRLITKATRLVVPKELKTEWRHWNMERRADFISRVRAKLNDPHDRPNTPFSFNVRPFDYTTPAARRIIARENKGRGSHHQLKKIKIGAQGVIWDGRLWYWTWNFGYIPGDYCFNKDHRISLHRSIWERVNGRPLPPKHVIRFADGNVNNFHPDNLVCASRATLAVENKAAALTRRRQEKEADLFFQHTAAAAAVVNLTTRRKAS